jgi:hypothetical protein
MRGLKVVAVMRAPRLVVLIGFGDFFFKSCAAPHGVSPWGLARL